MISLFPYPESCSNLPNRVTQICSSYYMEQFCEKLEGHANLCLSQALQVLVTSFHKG